MLTLTAMREALSSRNLYSTFVFNTDYRSGCAVRSCRIDVHSKREIIYSATGRDEKEALGKAYRALVEEA